MSLHIGICGAGIGGLAAAIALSRAGAQVTVLEAASSLGEIGAGIQMTPNASRLLIKWGVADIIGENLVEVEELNLRKRDGTKVGYTRIKPNFRRDLGYPWWVVHRAHLHEGLVRVAEEHGARLLVNSRVVEINHQDSDRVDVEIATGKQYTFDLLIGADGVNSIVRQKLFPGVNPEPPTNNCAYRAIIPCEMVQNDPATRELVKKLTMEVWMSDRSYIIMYPINAGKDINLVLSHHVDHVVKTVEDIGIKELVQQYAGYDSRIRRIVEMIPEAQRWPLLAVGPLKSWSSPKKNVVIMGDAAHAMVNHMAQGAATSMEDGAFLGRCIQQLVQKRLSLKEAIEVYEKARIPKAHLKQQISFLNGVIWQLPDGPAQEARNNAMRPELEEKSFLRSPNLYGDPTTVLSVYGYDAEDHADMAISEFLSGTAMMDHRTKVTKDVAVQHVKWFLQPEYRMGGSEVGSKL